MRGFFIFLVFICKTSVWATTRKRHPKLLKCLCAPIEMVIGKKVGALSTGSSPDLVGDLVNSGREQFSMIAVHQNDLSTVQADANHDLVSSNKNKLFWPYKFYIPRVNGDRVSESYKSGHICSLRLKSGF